MLFRSGIEKVDKTNKMTRLTHARILEQWGERKKWSRKRRKKANGKDGFT